MSEELPYEIEKAMEDLGLDRDEIAVIKALVGRGPTSVGEISKNSGLSRTKTYTTLDNLEKDGWVRCVSTTPRKYELSDVESIIRKRENRITRAITTLKKELIPRIKPQKRRGLIVVKEMDLLRRFNEMLNSAKNYIFIAPEFLPENLLIGLSEDLKKAIERGAKISMIINNSKHMDYFKNIGVDTIKIKDIGKSGLLIVDGKELIIATLHNGISGIYTTEDDLISFAEAMFNGLYHSPNPENQ